jgi:hypothetical protein
VEPHLQSSAQDAIEALQRLLQSALADTGHAPSTDPIDLSSVALTWHPQLSAEELAETAQRLASECASRHHTFRPGHVYCYACQGATCDHSTPPAAGCVFSGYESTGRPQWEELFNYFLQIEDPRTDLLFAERPEMLARVIGRRRLTDEQLTSFGKNSFSYRVWGQVVAGYLHINSLRAALTVQLVETKDHRVHLQTITDEHVRDALANAPPNRRSAFHRVFDALTEARGQTFSLSNAWQHAKTREAQDKIRANGFSLLRHLAHSIERKGRQHHRRTAHAELRGQQRRPVHKAHDDLKGAPLSDVMRDTFKESVIVLGKAGRLHAFADGGKHITSLVIRGDELERRKKRRRYQSMAPEEASAFRDRAMASLPPPAAAPGAARARPEPRG